MNFNEKTVVYLCVCAACPLDFVKKILVLLMTVLLAILASSAAAGASENQTGASPARELTDGWSYRWGDFFPDENLQRGDRASQQQAPEWEVLETLGTPEGRRNNTILWLKVFLPEGKWETPTLLVHRVYFNFELYVDGEVVYRFGEITSTGAGSFHGLAWHMIPVREEWLGKAIFFRVASDIRRLGVRGPVFLGSRADLVSSMITKDIDNVVTGFLSLFLGIAALALYARRPADKIYASFSLFAISVGVYILCLSRVHQLFFYAPLFFFGCWIASTALLPVGLTAFFSHLFWAGRNRMLTLLWQFLALLAAVMIFPYLMTGEVSVIEPLLYVSRLCYLVAAGIVCAALFSLLRRKNSEVLLFSVGFGVFLFFALHNTLVFLHLLHRDFVQIEYGMFFFLLVLSVILIRRFSLVHEKLGDFSQRLRCNAEERQRILQDLHDGVGGMLTNIKLLSEIAKESHSVDHMKKTLGTVTDLSRNSLEEIGTFLDVLDEQEVSWQNLVAEFRHFGVSSIEPHNMEFRMESNVHERVEPPGSLISVNLMKIYREAITNIIKHSKGTLVDIRFDLTATMLDLSIRNDGAVSLSTQGRGHGLNSMRKRAASIGAQLDISFSQGACVHLNMPLNRFSDNNPPP